MMVPENFQELLANQQVGGARGLSIGMSSNHGEAQTRVMTLQPNDADEPMYSATNSNGEAFSPVPGALLAQA